MIKKFSLLFFFFFQIAIASPVPKIIKNTYNVKYGENDRRYELEFKFDESDPDMLFYRSFYSQGNPFIPYPFCIMKDTVIAHGKQVYSETYHTGTFGLRETLNLNPNAKEHLIMSGDSNMFGIGVADEQALPSRVGMKSNTHKVYNMGLAGTGPNSALYFLQHFDLKKLFGQKMKGIFIYDFHAYLFERVIGSKAYMAWSVNTPRYTLENGKVVYKGPFSEYWVTKFYQFLNKLPYNEKLFPNLPRIGHGHIEFTAKVFGQIKAEYLRQTNSGNQFYVSINPKYEDLLNEENTEYLIECLKKENIAVITFSPEEVLDLPQIVGEGHFNHIAHENYSKMLMEKLKLIVR